jgi:sugar-specific transcriptional regulator TrmB
VGRQELYRILDELAELGLVEKEISTPTQFSSLPLSKGALVLLSHKRREISELEAKIQRIEDKNRIIEFSESQESEFYILPRKHLMEKRGECSYRNAKKNIEFFSPFRRLESCFSYNLSIYCDPVERGIDMRVITEKVSTRKYEQLKKEAATIFSKKNFNIRFATPFDNVAFSLIDSKEAYFPLDPSKNIFEDQSLWTNNKSLIILARKYFNSVWQHACDT